MKPDDEPEEAPGGGLNPVWLVPFVLAFGLGAVAISTQSFWPDEAVTGIIAMQPTPGAWWHAMRFSPGSEQQMPIYMAYLWLWEKLWGGSEWLLRASNLPWVALGLLAVPRRQPLFKLLLLASPFGWYYLNEARPYVLQIYAGLLLLASGWRLQLAGGREEKIFTAMFAASLVLLAGSSLLGMIWAGAFLASAILFFGREKSWRLFRENRTVVLVTALLLAALAVYYLWTVARGTRATPGETGAGNTAFIGYELLGFTGLGPGRADIRAHGLRAFLPFAPVLLLYAVAAAAVLWAGAKKYWPIIPRRVALGVLLAFGAAAIFLLAAGMGKHFSVLGRHCAPLVPLFVLWFAAGAGALWARGITGRGVVVIFIILQFGSALSLRFGERHTKEDYRAAATHARDALARGERVWWCADMNGGAFYGVPLSPPGNLPAPNQAWVASGFPEMILTNQPLPDLVILSRPENYDPLGFVRALMTRQHYHSVESPRLFTLWRPAGTNVPVPAKNFKSD